MQQSARKESYSEEMLSQHQQTVQQQKGKYEVLQQKYDSLQSLH